jgi:hypothetical protein
MAAAIVTTASATPARPATRTGWTRPPPPRVQPLPTLKDILAARNARRRDLKRAIGERTSLVDRLLADRDTPVAPLTGQDQAHPGDVPPAPPLRRYREEWP